MIGRLRRLRTGLAGNADRILLRDQRVRALLARSSVARRAYLVASSAFSREASVVLHGLATPAGGDDGAGPGPDYYWARRAVHRLEKGIISRPRRSVFARDYAPRLVDLLVAQAASWDERDPEVVAWCGDVLGDYFATVDCTGEPVLEAARDRFEAWRTDRSSVDPATCERRIPRAAGDRAPSQVSYDDLRALALRRRSVRWFLPERVPRDLLDRAIEVAGQSPSACNRQPFTFHVADDPELAARLGALAMGTAGFAHQFPCCIAVVGEQRAFVELRDRHVIYIDGGLASMALLFALETLGLSACTINWPDIASRERAIRDLLGLRPDQQTIMLIAVGYPDPDGGIPNSTKKSLPQLRRYLDG
jgi:nitroreductase